MIYALVAIACCLLIGLFSFLLYRRARAHLWDWVTTLAATLLSVMLALVVGLWAYDYQAEQDDQREKDDLTTLLKTELMHLHTHLKDATPAAIIVYDSTYRVVITYIQPIVLEQAAQSGLFGATESGNMLEIARAVRLYNADVEFLMAMISSNPLNPPDYQDRVEFMVDNLEDLREAIITMTGTQTAATHLGIDFGHN